MEQQLLAAAAAASSSTLNVDSIIQSALAAGLPPQQIIQFVQQRQALQQQNAMSAVSSALQQTHQMSATQTPAGSTVSSTTPAHTLSGFSSLNNIAAVLAQQQAQAQQAQNQQNAQQAQMAAILQSQAQAQQAQQAQNQQAAAQQAAAQQAALHAQQQSNTNTQSGEHSLPWPIFQPTVNVPYFDMNTYQKVNLDVQASALPSGMDLPLHDMNTLRFFFNFGVHHARAILLREHFHIATPNGQPQQGGTQSQQNQGQSQQSTLLNLQHQDQYQQALLKAAPEALTNAKSMGSASSASDPNAVFQLQRDLSTSISINQLQNTLAAQMNKMGGQAAIGQSGIGGANFKNDQIEALLMQNSMLGQQGQGMQFRMQSSAANQTQQQTQPEGLHRPTAIMPTSMSLGLTSAGKVVQTQQGQIPQQGQHQLLGGLGISAAAVQQQVPVDPAPRMAAVGLNKPITSEQLLATVTAGKPSGGVANPVPLTSSVLASFLQEQQANDRMKPTSLVRGSISDVARPVASIPASSASPIASQNAANVTSSTAIAAPIASTAANGGMSLAAQLSLAMMNGAYFQEQKQRIENSTTAKAPGSDKQPPAGLNVSSDNPDAHLLAGTSPFVKLMGTTAATTRSLTAGTSANHVQGDSNAQVATTSAAIQPSATTINGQQQSATTAPSVTHPYLMGPFGGADLDPTTFLAATELNYTEAFRRSINNDQRDAGTPENQRRKSGIYMLPGGNGSESKEEPAEKKVSTDKPIGPTMINYVNSCLNQLKSKVQSHGVGLNVDANFRPIDYSSRPIDAIFRKAREQLDRERDLTQHRASVSPALLQRLHAGSNSNSAGNEDELGRSGVGSDDGPSSVPATAQQTEIGTENGGRSKSEQPADIKTAPESEPISSVPPSAVEAKSNEVSDDGAPDAKRARIEETSESKTENAEIVTSSS